MIQWPHHNTDSGSFSVAWSPRMCRQLDLAILGGEGKGANQTKLSSDHHAWLSSEPQVFTLALCLSLYQVHH